MNGVHRSAIPAKLNHICIVSSVLTAPHYDWITSKQNTGEAFSVQLYGLKKNLFDADTKTFKIFVMNGFISLLFFDRQ